MKYYYVYILQCSDDSYYTGVTNDVDRRVKEHNEGSNKKLTLTLDDLLHSFIKNILRMLMKQLILKSRLRAGQELRKKL